MEKPESGPLMTPIADAPELLTPTTVAEAADLLANSVVASVPIAGRTSAVDGHTNLRKVALTCTYGEMGWWGSCYWGMQSRCSHAVWTTARRRH